MNIFKNSLAAKPVGERIAELKAKGFRRYAEDNGAIDLASIMVGVIVIGIVGGVIAAAVFGVIPWSQDHAASQQLDAVKTAESVQYAQSADQTGGSKFLGATALGTTANASNSILLTLPTNNSVDVVAAADGSGWVAVSKSPTGTHYYSTSLNTTPVTIQPGAAAANGNPAGEPIPAGVTLGTTGARN
jgi:type II secretory pathway pseudopilin PulG